MFVDVSESLNIHDENFEFSFSTYGRAPTIFRGVSYCYISNNCVNETVEQIRFDSNKNVCNSITANYATIALQTRY